MTIAGLNVDRVVVGYEDAAWWSSYSNTDDRGGEPLDNYMNEHGTEPSEALKVRMRADVEGFLQTCEGAGLDLVECLAEHVGHDLWLTRNRHGVGFWDRDAATYGSAAVRDTLDRLSKDMGEVFLWVDTDTNTVEGE